MGERCYSLVDMGYFVTIRWVSKGWPELMEFLNSDTVFGNFYIRVLSSHGIVDDHKIEVWFTDKMSALEFKMIYG